MAVEENVKKKGGATVKLAFFIGTLIIFLIILGIGFAYMQYTLFKVKAEGIAIGYQKAAASAYQMGRPIPDSIFEEGNYRVEVKTSFNSSGQASDITINVKDLYTNYTHYTSSRPLSNLPVQQNSNSMPIPQSNPQVQQNSGQ
ncbi:MAG: hypothetical protein U0354_14935 [Candidatus Sericytochromatia bacterium]